MYSLLHKELHMWTYYESLGDTIDTLSLKPSKWLCRWNAQFTLQHTFASGLKATPDMVRIYIVLCNQTQQGVSTIQAVYTTAHNKWDWCDWGCCADKMLWPQPTHPHSVCGCIHCPSHCIICPDSGPTISALFTQSSWSQSQERCERGIYTKEYSLPE